jgi:hypothetical protein
MNMRRILLVAVVNLLLVCNVAAQSRTNSGITKNDDAKKTSVKKKPSSRKSAQGERKKEALRRFWLSMSMSSVFDTNVTHDERGISSFGLVPSFGAHFVDNPEKPSFEADYEVGLHRYTNTNEFDRVSHYFTASYRRQLAQRWYAKTVGEVSLKGSSEDRDVNNQYILEQQLQYRLSPSNRLTAFAAYRLKRYPITDQGSNAIDSYVGGKYERKLKGQRAWVLGYRYDKNRSQDPRNRYIRWSYNTEFSTPVSHGNRDLLTLGVRYSPRLYARQIKVNGERVARRDRRWVFDALYERQLSRDVRMGWSYSYETRNSNDPDKKFASNLFGVTFNFNWWK